tara:strand:- start:834 stop:1010 length:177 start_codon:yes stop_codon:yes gene_type:complete
MAEQQEDPKVQMMAYPLKSQKDFLDRLNEITKVPTAERIREAIDLLKEKYSQTVQNSE